MMSVRQPGPVDDAIVCKMPENSMLSMSGAASNEKDQRRLCSISYIPKGHFYSSLSSLQVCHIKIIQ